MMRFLLPGRAAQWEKQEEGYRSECNSHQTTQVPPQTSGPEAQIREGGGEPETHQPRTEQKLRHPLRSALTVLSEEIQAAKQMMPINRFALIVLCPGHRYSFLKLHIFLIFIY